MCERVSRRAELATCALWALVALSCGDGTRAPSTDPGIMMLDPNQAHYERMYPQWAVAYMKWQFETSASVLWDIKKCTAGQPEESSVAFLDQDLAAHTEPHPCAFGSEKAFFFPLLPLGSPARYYTDSSMLGSADPGVLENQVKEYMDDFFIEEASISVDGRALRDPVSGRVQPTPYSYRPYPGDNLLFRGYGVTNPPEEVDLAFVAGYWVLLAPLAPGEHDLSLSIRVELSGTIIRNEFTYRLMLE